MFNTKTKTMLPILARSVTAIASVGTVALSIDAETVEKTFQTVFNHGWKQTQPARTETNSKRSVDTEASQRAI